MKNRSLKANLIRSLCGSSLIRTAALGLGLFATASFGQISPVGTTWDCLLSGGGQRGIMFLTFESDGTFHGHEMIVPRLSTTSSTSPGTSDDGRGGVDTSRGDVDTRTGTAVTGSGGSSTNSSGSTSTNLFGYEPITGGAWTMDSVGKITGAFVRHTASGDQPVSFRGKVRREQPRHLVLLANGVQTISGFSQTNHVVPPFNATVWDGFKFLSNPVPFPEVFTLTDAGELNLYSMDSLSAGGYSYSGGRCMVSTQKKIGFVVIEESGTNSTLRATIGPFYKKNFYTGDPLIVKTKGIIEPFEEVIFKAQLRTP
jgi:hypothetical protein